MVKIELQMVHRRKERGCPHVVQGVGGGGRAHPGPGGKQVPPVGASLWNLDGLPESCRRRCPCSEAAPSKGVASGYLGVEAGVDCRELAGVVAAE